MKSYDLTTLAVLDDQFRGLTDSLSERYKGNWDDKIHDSYLTYVKQVQELSLKLHEIRCRAHSLDRAINALNIDEIEQTAMSLRQEGDNV